MTYFISCVATAAIAIFGRPSTAMISLIVFMVVDYVTGVAKAIYRSNIYGESGLSSKRGFIGLIKKCGLLACIVVAHQLDRVTNQTVIREAVSLMLVCNEGISILENCVGLDIKVPQKLIDMLKKEGDKK